MNASIIIASPSGVSVGAEASRAKFVALRAASAIEIVKDEASQALAVVAQSTLHTLIKEVEDARVDVTKPLLDMMRKINAKSDEFKEPLREHELRISTLVGDYQAGILARQRSEQAARSKALSELESQREKALAQTADLEKRDEIQADFSNMAAGVAPVSDAPKAKGQRVNPTFEFDVTDARALYLSFPMFCNPPTPRLREIRQALASGTVLPGVKSWEVVKSTVAAQKEKVIEV